MVNKNKYDKYGILETKYAIEIYQQKTEEYEKNNGYVLVSDLFSNTLKTQISAEINMAFANLSVRRDFLMKHTGNSPRKMLNVRYSDIYMYCQTIRQLYDSHSIKNTLFHITKKHLHACPWENERYIATRLNQPGDTHGWHWDDYAWSLIFILEAPDEKFGGLLEIIPNTSWDKKDPKIDFFIEKHQIVRHHHRAGDVYLFRSDNTLHRVTPIQEGNQRTILNMSFASCEDLQFEQHKNHATMEELFA